MMIPILAYIPTNLAGRRIHKKERKEIKRQGRRCIHGLLIHNEGIHVELWKELRVKEP